MKQLVVVPLMVRVSAFIHVVVCSIGKLVAKLEVPTVSYFQVAIRAKQDAIAKGVVTTVFSWLPVMGLPTPTLAFGTVAPDELFTTRSAQSSLTFPSILYSVGRKGHCSTSRVEVANPRVRNGWIRNEGMWVLIRDGKSYNIAIVHTPPWAGRKGRYDILTGSKVFGSSRTLDAAKRSAEKIKTPRQPYK